MSLFDTLTDDDLPLNYRFPKWNAQLKYCLNSIVCHTYIIQNESQTEIYIAVDNVGPTDTTPQESIVASENKWRAITSRSIQNITGTNVDSDSIQFTVFYNDGESDSFIVDLDTITTQGGIFLDSESGTRHTVVHAGTNVQITPDSTDSEILIFSSSFRSESEVIRIIESDSDLDLKADIITRKQIAPRTIDSEHIESDFLARILSDVLPSDSSIIALIEGESDLDLFDNIITGDQIAPQSIESEHIKPQFLAAILSDVLPSDSSIIALIEGESDLDLFDNIIKNEHIAPMTIDSEHIESELLGRLLNNHDVDVLAEIEGSRQLIFTTSGNTRTLEQFKDSDNTVSNIRTFAYNSDSFILTLATFSPSFSAQYDPGASLRWDEPFESFTVSVNNPNDIDNQYISDVRSITNASGNVTDTLIDYNRPGKSDIPAPHQNWTEEFQTNNETTLATAFIGPQTVSLTGGSASFTVNFSQVISGTTSDYTALDLDFSISWATANTDANFSNLSGQTFLGTYNSVNYTVRANGASAASSAHTITAVGGTPSVSSGTGTVTGSIDLTTPIHKNNIGSNTVSISAATVYTRPIGVTGSGYTVNDSASDRFI